MTRIEAKVKKTKLGYRGYIVALEGSVKLWTQSTNIQRLNERDAREDAEHMKGDIMRANRI